MLDDYLTVHCYCPSRFISFDCTYWTFLEYSKVISTSFTAHKSGLCSTRILCVYWLFFVCICVESSPCNWISHRPPGKYLTISKGFDLTKQEEWLTVIDARMQWDTCGGRKKIEKFLFITSLPLTNYRLFWTVCNIMDMDRFFIEENIFADCVFVLFHRAYGIIDLYYWYWNSHTIGMLRFAERISLTPWRVSQEYHSALFQ